VSTGTKGLKAQNCGSGAWPSRDGGLRGSKGAILCDRVAAARVTYTSPFKLGSARDVLGKKMN